MFEHYFEALVSGIIYALAKATIDSDIQITPSQKNRVVSFVLDQHGQMPDYLRSPIKLLTIVFGLTSILRYGKSFKKLSLAKRSLQVNTWRGSSLGFRRDLIVFYESLALLGFYSVLTEKPVNGKG